MSARIYFYGDDFTGSTDALAQYSRFGLRGMLFFGLPEPTLLQRIAASYDVVGVAGVARSLETSLLDAEIRPVFERFREMAPHLVQYKICSTCDSSPQTGSFGVAIELGRELFGARCIPFVPAQPEFGRYTVFGNHFAKDGEETYRLDRHPTMARHPSTPIDEADMRLFLGRQTELPITSLPRPSAASSDAPNLLLRDAPGEPARLVVIDVLDQLELRTVGNIVWNLREGATVFVLGSGGLSYGIGAYLARRDEPLADAGTIAPVESLLAVSGSCAPRTAEQIRCAGERGWRVIRLDPLALADARTRDSTVARALEAAVDNLAAGVSVVVHSADGPDDPAIEATRRALHAQPERAPFAALLGVAFARIVAGAVTRANLRRCIIAGGDTSSYTALALDAYGLEIAALPAVAGAVCRLRSSNAAFDGLEVMLKGGQVGGVDLFEQIRLG